MRVHQVVEWLRTHPWSGMPLLAVAAALNLPRSGPEALSPPSSATVAVPSASAAPSRPSEEPPEAAYPPRAPVPGVPRCHVGRKLPAPPPTSTNPDALEHLQTAYRTLQDSDPDSTDAMLQLLYDDQQSLGEDDVREAREAYVIAAMSCRFPRLSKADAAELHTFLHGRIDRFVARYGNDPFSRAVRPLWTGTK